MTVIYKLDKIVTQFNGLTLRRVPGASIQEKLAVANHALHSLVGIEDKSRETLEHIKQEVARESYITMDTRGKNLKNSLHEDLAFAKSLWMAKTKACIAHTFPMDSD